MQEASEIDEIIARYHFITREDLYAEGINDRILENGVPIQSLPNLEEDLRNILPEGSSTKLYYQHHIRDKLLWELEAKYIVQWIRKDESHYYPGLLIGLRNGGKNISRAVKIPLHEEAKTRLLLDCDNVGVMYNTNSCVTDVGFVPVVYILAKSQLPGY